MAKSPIIYIRSSRKLCTGCWQAEKNTNRSLINELPHIIPWEAPLGYHFIVNDWFIDEMKGRKMAEWVYEYLGSALS